MRSADCGTAPVWTEGRKRDGQFSPIIHLSHLGPVVLVNRDHFIAWPQRNWVTGCIVVWIIHVSCLFVQFSVFSGNIEIDPGASHQWSDYWLQWSVQLRMSALVDINNININRWPCQHNSSLCQSVSQSVSQRLGFNKGKSSIKFWELKPAGGSGFLPSCWSLIHHYKPNFDNQIHEPMEPSIFREEYKMFVGENNDRLSVVEPHPNIGTFHFVSYNNQSVNAIKKHILSLTSIK